MTIYRNADNCKCDIAANFPITGNYGIISASLRTNANVIVVGPSLRLYGPSTGDLSITAYAPLDIGESLKCAATANVSFDWDQRADCDTVTGQIIMRFISRGRERAAQEGEITRQITMTHINANKPYLSFSASAGSGPHTPYILNYHYDGYDFRYRGNPLPITAKTKTDSTVIPFLSQILPVGCALHLTSFSWTYTPPEVPTVSYSFLFSYSEV
jgi:hypothetical protein